MSDFYFLLGHLLFLIFINDLLNDIKSLSKLVANDVTLLVKLLSKETTQMDLKKLSNWEDIWKLKFNLEKFTVFKV